MVSFKDRLKVETGRWQKPTAIPFNERKCTLCLKLDDKFTFSIRMSAHLCATIKAKRGGLQPHCGKQARLYNIVIYRDV